MNRIKLPPLAIVTILLTIICVALLAFSIYQTVKVVSLHQTISDLKSDVKNMYRSVGDLKELIENSKWRVFQN